MFDVQDPVIAVPSRLLAPNHKIDPFLEHFSKVSLEAYDPGCHLSGDEQVSSFQGRGADMQRITFKKAGDGYIIDSVCENGYTIAFYPHNVPADPEFVNLGFSPTHSRYLSMFKLLRGKNYTCGMDNLFIYTKFVRDAYDIVPSKVLVHGVCRQKGRGFPECAKQVEITGNICSRYYQRSSIGRRSRM